jgi:nucleoside-diphosphate-sugar epimerase
MQNLSTTHRADIRECGELLVPAGRGRTSFIDVRDIAEVAAQVLTERGHEQQAYALTGAEALTYAEVARIMAEELGRPIQYHAPGPLAFARHMRRRGYSRRFILVMVAIYSTARLGLAATVTPDTARLLGRQPRSVRAFTRDYRACWEA